jgi:hypothetical protein
VNKTNPSDAGVEQGCAQETNTLFGRRERPEAKRQTPKEMDGKDAAQLQEEDH